MPVATANGKKFTFPEGTTPEQMGFAIDEYFSQNKPAQQPAEQPQQDLQSDPYSSYKPQRSGIPDVALSLGSSVLAEPVAGIAGLASAPFFGSDEATSIINQVRDFMTIQPQTDEGKQVMQAIGKALQPIAQNLEGASQEMGNELYQASGSPAAGAYGATMPTALAEIASLGIGRGVNTAAQRAKSIAKAAPDAEKASTVMAGVAEGIPVLSTDVNPPATFMGKMLQSFSEKAGPLGSGPARAKQQIARQKVIEGLADEFDIDIQSPYAEQIVQNLKSESARKLANAEALRSGAVDRLSEFGAVPATKAKAAVARQAEKQSRLKAAGSPEIVDEMNDYISSIDGGDFSQFKDVRVELIRDIKALENATDSPNAQRRLQALTRLKTAIDEDMSNFASQADRGAAADWIKANRQFADELTNTKRTELKRILQKGDATPETVLTVLRGGKPSELKRLKSSIGPDGIKSAQAAIVRDILDESGFFRGDVNPNRVATALGKTKRQQAINTFFDEAGKTRLQGLRKLLDATRRAQDASAAPPTGVQLIPFAGAGTLGAGLTVEPLTTMAVAGTMASVAKAYESRAMRNLLMRIGQAPAGSVKESRLLDAAATAFLSEVQASKQEQGQNQ